MYQFANRIVTPEDHQKLLLTFARTDTLSWSATGELDHHWLNANNPVRIFDKGSPWSFEWDFQSSAWDWYNGFTYLAKKYSVNRQYESLHRGFSLIKSELCLPA